MPSSLSTASAQSASSSTGRHSGAGTPRAKEIIFCGGLGSGSGTASSAASACSGSGTVVSSMRRSLVRVRGRPRRFAAPPGRILGRMRRVVRFLERTIRTVRLAASDPRIPKPLRVLAGFGLLPIPGPVDEAVLLVVAVPLALLYREPLADAWRRAATAP